MDTRKLELDGLLKEGTFMPMPWSKVPRVIRIFGSKFVDVVIKAGETFRKKSHIVAQNYSDEFSC